ncbi:DUF2239 family protein [Glaciimonas soli]|uniref:DUF2239 family protein n=1 Tax=Glaciimonas soli TaxID=2590999 RepID=A0A843YQ76_9BURK|nr:DUF2239 family protein [Glaciimonas soli]MQQ99903.1 DUF2239 family protein [Glaciimonas soli]
MTNALTRCTAFHQDRRIASGELSDVALQVKTLLDQEPNASVLIFDDASSHTIELDFRGTAEDVLSKLPTAPADNATDVAAEPETMRGPGRPKLGVIGKEITLLPRHWDWLGKQPGGASVVIRKLVEEAKRTNDSRDHLRQAQESTYRFMSTMSGNQTGFEEATRALFAGDQVRFTALVSVWPADICDHIHQRAALVFKNTP